MAVATIVVFVCVQGKRIKASCAGEASNAHVRVQPKLAARSDPLNQGGGASKVCRVREASEPASEQTAPKRGQELSREDTQKKHHHVKRRRGQFIYLLLRSTSVYLKPVAFYRKEACTKTDSAQQGCVHPPQQTTSRL